MTLPLIRLPFARVHLRTRAQPTAAPKPLRVRTWAWSSLLLAGAASLASAQGVARFMTAGELHQRLTAPEPAAREAGRHYVLGVIDSLALSRDPRVCLGAGVSATRYVEVVAEQLANRPDLHRFNAASLVREAVATAFPCT